MSSTRKRSRSMKVVIAGVLVVAVLLLVEVVDRSTSFDLKGALGLKSGDVAEAATGDGTFTAVGQQLGLSVETARDQLTDLPVKGRAPKTGYDREEDYGDAWKDVDDNGCRTRDDILARDLTEVRTDDDGCKVLSGVLDDPYTGETIDFTRGQSTSSAVQIDHVVALMNSWETGAQQLNQSEREELANDPLNLRAVDGPANSAKGAGDTATWLPPNKAFRCEYVTNQIAVKAKYELWVTSAEKDAMEGILEQC